MKHNMLKIVRSFSLIPLLLFILSARAFSQADDVCLECHSEPDIQMEKNGRTISLHVKKYELKRSVHAKLRCVQCHVGFDPYEMPHKENIRPVNCMGCHKDPYKKHAFHPGMKIALNDKNNSELLDCKRCHGTHEILASEKKLSNTNAKNSTEFCGSCHEKEKEQHIKSEHYVSVNQDKPNAPTCIYCHVHPITKGYGLDPVQLKLNQEKLCLSCHLNNPNQTQYSKSLVSYEQSVHGAQLLKGNQNAAVCVDCHGSHDLEKANSPDSRINRYKIPQVCGKCHISIAHEYESSIHGIALLKGNKDVPGCTFCHGEHNIVPVPDVPTKVFNETHINKSTFIKNKMVYCVVCHVDEKMMDKYNISTVQKAHEWLPNQAVHWETVRCVDCHSSYVPPNLSHNILPPEKTVKKCEECHSKNSILMTKLYKHEKETSREKFGFINGTILSDAYVIGTTRNVLLDTLSLIIFSVTLIGIGLHILLRWYFNRAGKTK